MADEGEGIKDHLLKKYGPAGIRNFGNPNSYLYTAGREAGIEFKTERNIYPTVRAHALMEYVKLKLNDNDMANKLMEELYERYFERGENINSVGVLSEVARTVGIDNVEKAREAMEDPDLHQQVREKDQEYKTRMRVGGVPFYVIERNDGGRPIAFSGAQPADVIAEQLEIAAEE